LSEAKRLVYGNPSDALASLIHCRILSSNGIILMSDSIIHRDRALGFPNGKRLREYDWAADLLVNEPAKPQETTTPTLETTQ